MIRVLFSAALLALPGAARAEGLSVLFVGNSYTSTNDLPHLFAALAASLGTAYDVDSFAPGGYTFEQHAKDANTYAKIAARRWSFVVLQEQSQRPAFGADQTEPEVAAPAAKLASLAQQVGARAVFFETWGRRDGDKDNCRELPALCTYDGMQDRLNATYEDIARRASARLAPVGDAWRSVRRAHPEIDLYDAAGNHPSRAGTYLAACVLYVTLSHRGAIGADALGLDRGVAAALQKAAQDAVFARGRAVKRGP